MRCSLNSLKGLYRGTILELNKGDDTRSLDYSSNNLNFWHHSPKKKNHMEKKVEHEMETGDYSVYRHQRFPKSGYPIRDDKGLSHIGILLGIPLFMETTQ